MSVTCIKISPISLDNYYFGGIKKNDIVPNGFSLAPKLDGNSIFPGDGLFKKIDGGQCGMVKPEVTTKVYKRRFVILFLFCVCSMLNAFQFIQYSIISNIIECYHGVSAFDVNWTSTVYMIAYGLLVFPVSWFLNRFNTRTTLLTGSLLNTLASIIQCFSMNRDGFGIALFSQTLAAIAQVFILPLPPGLAAIWFHPKEVGRATAIGVIGNQIGTALGFLVPPMVVTNDCSNPDLIRQERSIMGNFFAAVNVINFLLLLSFFKKQPPLPPSRALQTSKPSSSFKKSLINQLKNCNFLVLLLIYGIITGVAVGIATLLNQILAPMFKNSEQEIGWVGIVTVFSGFFSSFLAGYATDITHKYKETSFAICFISFLATLSFTGLLSIRQKWIQYLTVIVNGFSLVSYFPVGFDFAAEITYPEPEGTAAGLMNASSMIFSAAITMLSSVILQNRGPMEMGLFCSGCILVACIASALMKPELRRFNASEQEKYGTTKI